MSFLLGSGALIVMTGLCLVQAVAYSFAGNYPQALMMVSFAVADASIIWSTMS